MKNKEKEIKLFRKGIEGIGMSMIALSVSSILAEEFRKIERRCRFMRLVDNLFCGVLLALFFVLAIWFGIASHPWIFK